LHFAGNKTGTMGVANPIQSVLDELNVDICTGGVSVITTPVVCRPLLTQPWVCGVVTRPVVCAVVTQPSICRFGPLETAACPDPPLERFRPREIGSFDPRGLYGTPAADHAGDAYWQGYEAALEAVKRAEEEAKRE